VAAGLACLLAGGLLAGLAGCGSGTEEIEERPARFVIPPPEVGHLRWNNDPTLAFSRDGSLLAYLVFQEDESRQIHVRDMAAGSSRPVPGTEGGDTPFFSPDGQWLGFFADGSLKKVPLSGGEAVTLTPKATNLRGASWGPSDTIIFNLTDTDVLYEVSAQGGEPRQLTTLGEGERSHRWPQFLPDGSAVLFTIARTENPDDSEIAALRLDSGEKVTLVRGGTFGRYATTGHLVYHHGRAILAVGIRPAALEVTGMPTPVAEGILGSPPDTLTGVAQFAFSSTGTLAYVQPRAGGANEAYEIHVWPNWFGELTRATAEVSGQ
jgi:serine/threonine-protein kinase